MSNFWSSWKTTGAAIAIIILWVLKLLVKIEIPTEVAAAITALIISIGLFFSKDADVTGIK